MSNKAKQQYKSNEMDGIFCANGVIVASNTTVLQLIYSTKQTIVIV